MVNAPENRPPARCGARNGRRAATVYRVTSRAHSLRDQWSDLRRSRETVGGAGPTTGRARTRGRDLYADPRCAEKTGACRLRSDADRRSKTGQARSRGVMAPAQDHRPVAADVIHGFLFDGDFYSRVAALGSGIQVLNSERSEDYRLSWNQRLAHRLTRRLARGVVANTFSGKAFAQRLFGLSPDDVHVVWNGIRLEELERQASAATADYRFEFFGDRRVRVACLVGSISPVKNYHLALDSAARLIAADPVWRVLLIGGSETRAYKAEVLKHYERLGLSDKIKFAGLRTDVPAIVRQCDVLYVTSAHEGFPNSVLEAMGLGVPVVSTEYSDIRRILPFPRQVVARHSPEDIARAVIWAYAERDVIAARQKQWVHAYATIDKAAEELERVYGKYVRSNPCAQPA